MQKSMSVRSSQFHAEHRGLVIQRIQGCRLTSLDKAECKISGITGMAVTVTSGRNEMSHYSQGFICAFSVHIHVFL